ncbi:hypothetical protein PROFUN_09462 [Planoprotostelium fungivorum]|uniref:Uncharacterized protein n=1 Tax=Planoprotostelium fungivorum TaxID=1890364 RepID=A0A2P6NH22_9EUKA|nr:hypothetical protein PROFUN_09462 [Planoprotostelium fungivorum]
MSASNNSFPTIKGICMVLYINLVNCKIHINSLGLLDAAYTIETKGYLVPSLTKPQDETTTRQTSLVLDYLKTVLVLFFLFLGATLGTNPLQDHAPKVEREESKDVERLWQRLDTRQPENKKNLSLASSDSQIYAHNTPILHKNIDTQRLFYFFTSLALYPKRVVLANIKPSRTTVDITSAVTSQTWLGYHRKMEHLTTFLLERAKHCKCMGAISGFNPHATEVYPLPHLGHNLTNQQRLDQMQETESEEGYCKLQGIQEMTLICNNSGR